jgi:hypothetical protein
MSDSRTENWYEGIARSYFPFLSMAKDAGTYSEKETAQRRDEALRRALMTPPKPHQSKPAKAKGRAPSGASAKPKTAP